MKKVYKGHKSPFLRILFLMILLLLIGSGLWAEPPALSGEELTALPFLSAVGKAGEPLSPQGLADFIRVHPPVEARDEYIPVLLSLLKPGYANRSVRVTGVDVVDPAQWKPVQEVLSELREVDNRKAGALVRLLTSLLNPKGERGVPMGMGAFLSAKDDWEAYILYRVAAKGAEPLGDIQLSQALDPARPSLAAAALEDRFGDDYLQKDLPPLASLNLDPETRKAILEKCLKLKNSEEPRILLPVLHTLILLGRAEYLQEYIILSTHRIPEIRGLAYLGLMRFADTSLFRFFLTGLKDENSDVRLLSVKGLGAIRDVRGIEPLAAILNDPEENLFLRLACARALGEIGDRRIGRVFKDMLLLPAEARGFDTAIRIEAARNLGRLREKSAVEALLANIDPQRENQLNYECLYALGKINSVTGYQKLLPLGEEGFAFWIARNSPQSNLYGFLWALFLYRSDNADELFRRVYSTDEEAPKYYDSCSYIAAWHLYRGIEEPGDAETLQYRKYLDYHRSRFFTEQRRVYDFCMILKGRWDEDILTFLSSQINEYNDAVKTWVLSSMTEQPSLSFIPAVEQVHTSSDRSVRVWAASVLHSIARQVLGKKGVGEDEAGTAAEEIAQLVNGWKTTEEDSQTLRFLEMTEKLISAFLDQTT